MIPLRSIEHITAWPLAAPPRVRLTPGAAPPISGAAAARWADMCRANPRHFDGPLLSVVTFDSDANEVLARRDGYARLAVQPQVRTGVQQLSITAVLLARDASGREHVLLGRRSRETRIFGGMWEVGPSGGLPPPPASIEELPASAILNHAADEVAEEVGLTITTGRAVAYLRDESAHSDDICIACDVGPLESVFAAGPANWEYTETRWTPTDTIAQFDTDHATHIINATRALFRVMGWVHEPF